MLYFSLFHIIHMWILSVYGYYLHMEYMQCLPFVLYCSQIRAVLTHTLSDREVDMLHSHYEILLIFLLSAALEDLRKRKLPPLFFLFSFFFFFLYLGFSNNGFSGFYFLHFPLKLILSLLLSYPPFYLSGSGGADWKLCSLLFALLPLEYSLSILLLSTPFSFLLFYLLKEDIPFIFSLFLSAVPILSLF